MADQPKKPDLSAATTIADAMAANAGTGKVVLAGYASKFVAEQGANPKAEPGKNIIASYTGQKAEGSTETLKGGTVIIDELRAPAAADTPSAPKAKGRAPTP